jgi:bifunctional non-homologous end joining protein LigD
MSSVSRLKWRKESGRFAAYPLGSHHSEMVATLTPNIAKYQSWVWLKVKCVQRQEFVVVGWRPPDYGVDNVRGLFLATYEGGQLVYKGGVGTGFTDKMRREVWEVLQLIRADAPLSIRGIPRAEARACRWVEPRLLAEVEYTEITPDGLIRHPSFKGLREDKDARAVHLEE